MPAGIQHTHVRIWMSSGICCGTCGTGVVDQKHEARTSPLECCCFVVFLFDRHINDVVLAVFGF